LSFVYVDGNFVPKDQAVISVFDHGLLYGDGIFEGIRLYNKKVFELDRHLERLYNSAKVLMLKIPLSKENLRETILETCRKNSLSDGYLRVVITRGIGDLGLDPEKCHSPSVIVIVDKIIFYPREYYENGMSIITVPTRRNSPEGLNPRIKSLNYLNNIMAKMEARCSGAPEALMLNNEGYVAECTGDNIFIFKNASLLTPSASSGALKGITQEIVIELARELNIPCKETILSRYDLFIAEECFLTGTAAEIVPVVEIDRRKIGSGRVGSVTKRLMTQFREKVQNDGTPL